ncbi:MAG: hypothetical protein DME99_12635 [Verrucomicrobia bacterium]|nr:MAG: hypothetical protein DME99_12635 [Verrucomicrobiota bacterium]
MKCCLVCGYCFETAVRASPDVAQWSAVFPRRPARRQRRRGNIGSCEAPPTNTRCTSVATAELNCAGESSTLVSVSSESLFHFAISSIYDLIANEANHQS